MTPTTKIYDLEFYTSVFIYWRENPCMLNLHWKYQCLSATAAGKPPKSVHAKPTPLAVTKHISYVESREFILHSRSKYYVHSNDLTENYSLKYQLSPTPKLFYDVAKKTYRFYWLIEIKKKKLVRAYRFYWLIEIKKKDYLVRAFQERMTGWPKRDTEDNRK